jgi:hypothetical protein
VFLGDQPDQARRSRAAGQLAVGQGAVERLADRRIEGNPGPRSAHRDLGRSVAVLRTDLQFSAARQGVEADGREIEQELDGRLRQRVDPDAPEELDAPVASDQRLDQLARLLDGHRIAETTGRSVGEAEELQLVGADARALLEQLHAAMAHFRIALVTQQLKPVAERAHGAQHVMAQARAEQFGKIGGRCHSVNPDCGTR